MATGDAQVAAASRTEEARTMLWVVERGAFAGGRHRPIPPDVLRCGVDAEAQRVDPLPAPEAGDGVRRGEMVTGPAGVAVDAPGRDELHRPRVLAQRGAKCSGRDG